MNKLSVNLSYFKRIFSGIVFTQIFCHPVFKCMLIKPERTISDIHAPTLKLLILLLDFRGSTALSVWLVKLTFPSLKLMP